MAPRPGVIDILLKRSTQQEQEEKQAEVSADRSISSYLPASYRASQEKKRIAEEAKASGEDPRITEFFIQEQGRANAASSKYLPANIAKSKNEAAKASRVREFYAKNPDLDPRLADQKIEADGGEQAASDYAANFLKIITAAGQPGADFKTTSAASKAVSEYNKIKDQLSPGIKKRYGLDVLEEGGFFQQDESALGWKSNLADLVTTPGVSHVLQGFDKASQAGMATLGEIRKGDIRGAAYSAAHIGDPRTYLPGGQKRVEEMIRQSGLDLTGDGRLENMREALGDEVEDINRGGRWVGLLDFIAVAGSDPTSYLSLGTGKLAKTGLEMMEKQGLHGIVNQIKAHGVNSLDDVQRAAADAAVAASVDEIAGIALRGGKEVAAEKILKEVGRSGQRGIKVVGRTLNVPGGSKLDEIVRSKLRLPARQGVESSTEKYITRVNSWDITGGEKIEELGRATVKSYDPETRLLTIDPPTEKIAVLRKGETITVSPSELQPGDAFIDGAAKVTGISDAGIELELGKLLDNVERPFGVLPRFQTGGQGTLVGRKTADAGEVLAGDQRSISPLDAGRSEPGGNVRLSDIGRQLPEPDQGSLFAPVKPGKLADLPEPAAPAAAVPEAVAAAPGSEIDDAIAAVKGAEANTGAGGFRKQIEDKLKDAPVRPIGEGIGVKSADDGFGGKFLSLVDDEGEMLGYLYATDDAISTFENVSGVRGMGQRLLKAAADEGLDVPRLLAGSSFTDDVIDVATGQVKRGGGRQAALRYLEGLRPKAAPDILAERAVVPRVGNRRIDTISYPVRKPNGTEVKGRIWRQDKKPVTAGFELLDKQGATVGKVVDWVGDNEEILRLDPTTPAAVGDKIPAIRGVVQAVNDDGTLDVALDLSTADNLAGEAAEAVTSPQVTGSADVSPIVSRAQETAAARPAREAVGDAVTIREADETLDTADAFTDPKIVEERARVRAGAKPKEAEEALQQTLFERGFISTEHVGVGDRMPSIAGRVVKKLKGRQIVAELDDAPVTVVRDDKVLRIDASEAVKGDVHVESGLTFVSKNADGTVTLKGIPMHALREGIEKQLGGLAPQATLAQRMLERQFGDAIRTFRDAVDPRGTIEASERAGRLTGGTAKAIGRATAQERARLENAVNEAQIRLGSVQKRLEKDLGLREARETLTQAFDVSADSAEQALRQADELAAAGDEAGAEAIRSVGGERALMEANNLDKIGKTKAAAALRTMNDIVKEIKAIRVGDEATQGTLGMADPQMPLILTKQGKKALALEPAVAQDLLGLQRQLDNITAGFDFSEAAGRGVLRIEAPGIAKKGNFIEIDLSRSARDVNEQIAEAVSDSTKAALGVTDNKPLRIFEENPLTAYAFRNRTAQTEAIQADLVLGLQKNGVLEVIGKSAVDDAFYQQAEAAARRKGWVEVPGWESPVGKVFAPPEVAKEMSKVRAILRNSDELKAWKKNLDKMTALWTRQVLSPITKGLSYPIRNLQGNLINALFGGMTVKGQALATKIQAGPLRKAGKLMREEGLSFDAAIARLDLDQRTEALIRYMRDDDIMNTGLYRVLDWGDTIERGTAGADATSRAKRFVGKRLSPLSADNVLIAPGRRVNTAIEDNSRMALYISVFDATGSRDAAREAVAKYLFDYADLTPFESSVMKSINAFYTFMRKNTALQLKVFADRPALPINVLRAKAALSPGGSSGLLYPGEEGQEAGGFLQSIMGGQGVVRIDDPVTAAIRTIDPFIQTAYMGLNKVSDGRLEKYMPQAEMPTGRSVTSGYLGLTSGAPADFITTIYEMNTGVDTFTGRPLEGNAFDQIVKTVAPVWGQGYGVATSFDDSAKLRQNLLRMITGLSFYRREPGSESLMWAMSSELEETLLQLKAKGVDVPSIDDMRAAGLLPSLTGDPKARTVPLPEEDRRAAALDKLLGK